MDIWFTSDTHFGHANIINFEGAHGPVRPEFSCVEEMDEAMIDRWNRFVKDGDRVYHLGDVCMDRKKVDLILPRLKGSKRLILGNHDMEVKKLAPHFKWVRLWRHFDEGDFVCSHIPLMESQFRFAKYNVHGHMHERKMARGPYLNVCVEQWGFSPVHMDTVLAELAKIEG